MRLRDAALEEKVSDAVVPKAIEYPTSGGRADKPWPTVLELAQEAPGRAVLRGVRRVPPCSSQPFRESWGVLTQDSRQECNRFGSDSRRLFNKSC